MIVKNSNWRSAVYYTSIWLIICEDSVTLFNIEDLHTIQSISSIVLLHRNPVSTMTSCDSHSDEVNNERHVLYLMKYTLYIRGYCNKNSGNVFHTWKCQTQSQIRKWNITQFFNKRMHWFKFTFKWLCVHFPEMNHSVNVFITWTKTVGYNVLIVI